MRDCTMRQQDGQPENMLQQKAGVIGMTRDLAAVMAQLV